MKNTFPHSTDYLGFKVNFYIHFVSFQFDPQNLRLGNLNHKLEDNSTRELQKKRFLLLLLFLLDLLVLLLLFVILFLPILDLLPILPVLFNLPSPPSSNPTPFLWAKI